ncbi:MBL fold metallo-hydrolase [Dokdonella soli]|uniref:MBL fold metallo-hydrolase n=1 Tax=Dokdonella soli TaxID=529810 RepID=A0ABN1IB68_9GAMM
MQESSPFEYLGDGITAIDIGLGRQRFGACYLIESNGAAALFDAGTNYSVPRILAAIAERSLAPDAVRYLIASHVHLDHAGGIGALLRELPNASVLAHPRGVPHLVDPSMLQASAEGVYGVDVVAQTYGELVPVPAQRIRALADDECIDLDGRTLRFMDSPGHARHHLTLYDETSASWFTGDCFGISYRDFDGGSAPFIFPTTSPIQFDPDAMKATIARMLERTPRAMLLTHYSRVEHPVERSRALIRMIDAQVELARGFHGRADAVAALTEALQRLYFAEVRRLGAPVAEAESRRLLAVDAELNAKGMLIWLDREGKA